MAVRAAVAISIRSLGVASSKQSCCRFSPISSRVSITYAKFLITPEKHRLFLCNSDRIRRRTTAREQPLQGIATASQTTKNSTAAKCRRRLSCRGTGTCSASFTMWIPGMQDAGRGAGDSLERRPPNPHLTPSRQPPLFTHPARALWYDANETNWQSYI